MGAKELLEAGKVAAAIEAATQDVKSAPGNVRARIFLFELLAANGEYDRARKHLDVVVQQAPSMQEGIFSYGGILDAELLRARIFSGGDVAPEQVTPIPGNPEPQLSALHLLLAGDAEGAKRLLDQREAERPSYRGTIDGDPFDDFRNADDVLAIVLEVFSQGRYGWIPLSDLKRVVFDAPKFFRDLLWIPATVALNDGSSSKMFVPARYPGSESASDDQLKLGRGTEWVDRSGVIQGIGQQAFLVAEELRYVLDIRELNFEMSTSSSQHRREKVVQNGSPVDG